MRSSSFRRPRFFGSPASYLLLVSAWLCCSGCTEESAPSDASIPAEEPGYDEGVWEVEGDSTLITATRALELATQGALLVDAREAAAFELGHLEGAVSLPWPVFVDGAGIGRVSDDDARLQTVLRAAGVSATRPIVVYGSWSQGGPTATWGEEGRVQWTLQYLGHPEVYVLIGGLGAATQEGFVTASGASVADGSGNFVIARDEALRATTDEVEAALGAGNTVVFLDAREPEEYAGEVRYGESRGGHLPGAQHLWWYELFAADGQLRSPESVRALLQEKGIGTDAVVIPYCTGGIRSGFVYTVLRSLGLQVQNYDASMWEWTADPERPLE